MVFTLFPEIQMHISAMLVYRTKDSLKIVFSCSPMSSNMYNVYKCRQNKTVFTLTIVSRKSFGTLASWFTICYRANTTVLTRAGITRICSSNWISIFYKLKTRLSWILKNIGYLNLCNRKIMGILRYVILSEQNFRVSDWDRMCNLLIFGETLLSLSNWDWDSKGEGRNKRTEGGGGGRRGG